MDRSVLKSRVNGFISLLFVGTFTLGALLIIWQKAFGDNPIENAMASYVAAEQQASN